MQATTMPKILAGLTRNSSTLSTKIARLRHTSAAAQYLSDVCKIYRLSMGTLFIPLVPSVHLHSRDIQAGSVAELGLTRSNVRGNFPSQRARRPREAGQIGPQAHRTRLCSSGKRAESSELSPPLSGDSAVSRLARDRPTTRRTLRCTRNRSRSRALY